MYFSSCIFLLPLSVSTAVLFSSVTQTCKFLRSIVSQIFNPSSFWTKICFWQQLYMQDLSISKSRTIRLLFRLTMFPIASVSVSHLWLEHHDFMQFSLPEFLPPLIQHLKPAAPHHFYQVTLLKFLNSLVPFGTMLIHYVLKALLILSLQPLPLCRS